MSSKKRNILCCCCGQDSAAVSRDKFPLAKKQSCASCGAQTEYVPAGNYHQGEYSHPSHAPAQYYRDQNEGKSRYKQNDDESRYNQYDDRLNSRNKNDDELRFQNDSSSSRYKNDKRCRNDKPCSRYENDVSSFQNDPWVTSNNNDNDLGNQKNDEMRCRYDPLSSRYKNDNELGGHQDEVTRDGDELGEYQDEVTRDGDENEFDQDNGDTAYFDDADMENVDGSKAENSSDGDGIPPNGGHDPRRPRRRRGRGRGGQPAGLVRTVIVARQSNQHPYPNNRPFRPNLRPYSAMPYYHSQNGLGPSGNGQLNQRESSHRRGTDPGRLQSWSMMETGVRRSRNVSSPFPRPPVTNYSMPQASYCETPFDSQSRDGSRNMWQNSNNPQTYLFGWGKKKASKKTADSTNKLKMLYQINNAGVTCTCGQRMQFNLSVEENEGRCIACFEELCQDFADLLNVYKEMGYTPCECKGRISVTDLANEYLMDQANNASGLGYEHIGAPRKKAPVKTIELTPTEGFTGCLCREIKMEMFRKPSDLLSCQCDTNRTKIVLRPLSEDDSVSEPPHESESESESDYEIEQDVARVDSSVNEPKIVSSETIYSAVVKGSNLSAFETSTPKSRQSTSSNATTFETATSDSSMKSNKTYILSDRE